MTDKRGTERVPITAELRAAMHTSLDIAASSPRFDCDAVTFGHLCDAIDAVHANLERENDGLMAELDRASLKYEPPVAAHWDGDVLTLTIPRDPSSIRVQRAEGQPLKVYVDEAELDRASLSEGDHGERVIGSAYVGITPRINWSRMVDELDVFTQLVRGFAEQVEVDE